MDFEQLGFVLRRCRQLNDVTVSELAEKAGIHRNTLSAYESGKRPLNDEMFVKLCLHLGMDVTEAFAAACLAKLEFVLRPLEIRMRGEMGLPEREIQEWERHPAEQYREILSRFLAGYSDLSEFTFKHVTLSSQHTLIRLRPSSLQNLNPDPSRRKRARKKSKKAGSADKARKGEGS